MPDFTSKELQAIYLKKRVNSIYRELRIHLYYKSMLRGTVTTSCAVQLFVYNSLWS